MPKRDESVMVPDPTFASYYGRQIVKPAPWKWPVPAYLYTGGLAAGSGFLATGAAFTGRRVLQRNARLTALAAIGVSGALLVEDLGKPMRFLNMMRTVKLTSPMSVGSWILTGYGAFTAVAAACDIADMVLPHVDLPRKDLVNTAIPWVKHGAGLGAGAFAAPLASYTAVLLSDTATPTWHAVYRELPFVFVGSALSAGAGAQLALSPSRVTGPARRQAVIGTSLELAAHWLMKRRGGLELEPLHHGKGGRLSAASQACNWGGLVTIALAGNQRPAGILGGIALNVGSCLTRFAMFHAGIESATDPKYTVIPQKERKAARAQA